MRGEVGREEDISDGVEYCQAEELAVMGVISPLVWERTGRVGDDTRRRGVPGPGEDDLLEIAAEGVKMPGSKPWRFFLGFRASCLATW